MVNEDSTCSSTNECELETRNEYNGGLKMTNREDFESDEVSQHQNNAFSLPDNIYRSGVSNCTGDIQVGTRIITPNVFVIDRNKESLNDIRSIINGADNHDINSNGIQKNCNLSTANSSKSVVKKGQIKVEHITIIVLTILSGLIIILFGTGYMKFNGNKNDVNLNSPFLTDSTITSQLTSQTTKEPLQKSFIITQEKCGDIQGEFCDSGNLTIADGVKISYTSNRCDTFDNCCESLKYEKSFDVRRCSYDDIHYHFIISEKGDIYEGRRTDCQIPLTYRGCNQSLLEIGIFTGRLGLICTDQYNKVIKQMEGLTKLIQYNINKTVISGSPLSLYFSDSSYTFCTEMYLKELHKTFNTLNIFNFSSNFCDAVCP